MPNMENNRIAADVQRIHLIAVCGTGMAALAAALKDLGFDVSGSDRNVYPPMSTFLAEKGIPIHDGYRPENLAPPPDLVVVGNAVSRDNPEVQHMIAAGLRFCSMPQAVNHFLLADRKPIVITGTHGKTTTAALMSWMLHTAELDPGFFIGGILRDFGSNYRLGGGPFMVLEGDEYDTAFFDKGPKFLHYRPAIAVLTSIEFDHADIFRDLNHIRSAFDAFLRKIPSESLLLAYDEDPDVADLIAGRPFRIQTCGGHPGAIWRLSGAAVEPPWTTFEVARRGRPYAAFRTRMMGRHNLRNALSVIAAAHDIGVPLAAVQRALETFGGVRRRQEVRGVRRGVTVIDDFAHHPTAVRETIKAVKPFAGGGRLIAVFEPRTNTSMRAVFQDVYPDAFDAADLVCVRRPPLLKKIPEGQRFSSQQLVEDLKKRGKAADYFTDTDGIIAFLSKEAMAGDVILVMSNGGFDNIHARLLERL